MDACRPDAPERVDLLHHPFFELDGDGPHNRQVFFDWVFGQTADGAAPADARLLLRKLEGETVRYKAAERLNRTGELDPRQDADFFAELGRRLAQLDAGEDTDVKWWTPAEFAAAEFHLEWLIPDLLVKGQPCLLGGPSKALKTSIAVDLALSLGAGGGRRFLDRWAVAGSGVPVGFISGESGQATIKETFVRVATRKGVNLAADNVHKCFRVPRLSSAAEMATLASYIRRHGLQVVVVDPLYLGLLAGDANGVNSANLFQMGPLLLEVSRACLQAGCTPILVHHTIKHLPAPDSAGCFRPLELEHLAFAGFAEFARQWLLVNRRRAYQDGSGSHELWLRYGGSAGHGGLWAVDVREGVLRTNGAGRSWEPRVLDPDRVEEAMDRERQQRKQQKQVEQEYRDRKAVLAALQRVQPAAETPKAIRRLADIPDSRGRPLEPILAELLEQGAVAVETVVKGNGREYTAYRFLFDPEDGQAHPGPAVTKA